MSAADLGMRLLNGCVETRLDDVLSTLRVFTGHDPDQDETLPILDRLLSINYAQTPGRQARFPAIEICAEDGSSARSQLVYYIIVNALLPYSHESIDLDGKESAVVLMDTEADFDVERLVQVMRNYLEFRSLSEEGTVTDWQYLIEQSLQHLHIFQPRSMSSLLETLNSLRDYLFNSSAQKSSGRAIHSVIIDSASAFYWETRAAFEDDRVAALDRKAPGSKTMAMAPPKPNPYALLVNRLRLLQQTLKCAVIATTTASIYKNAASGEQSLRTIPAPWAGFSTKRLMLKREQVRKFAVGTSWEDALKDKQVRQAAVELGRFSATLLDGGERFSFAVTKDGVKILHGRDEEDLEQ